MLVAADHDMSKSSLTPSVYLHCNTPSSVDKSFVTGQMNVAVNNSVLQQSSPFRHAVLLANSLKAKGEYPKVILKFSDGGTDQRNNLEAVKCASIALFKELDLDLLVPARCAPGNSWVNPPERVMRILNLGLQNCALERNPDDDLFSRANSMSQIRDLVFKSPELKQKWVSSIEPVQALIEGRFRRLSLKGEPFQVVAPATDDDLDLIKRQLRELFPEMDLSKLQKQHTSRVASYQRWLEGHCRQRQYSFQIKKCNDQACCLAPTTPPELLSILQKPLMRTDPLSSQVEPQNKHEKCHSSCDTHGSFRVNLWNWEPLQEFKRSGCSNVKHSRLFSIHSTKCALHCRMCWVPQTQSYLLQNQTNRWTVYHSSNRNEWKWLHLWCIYNSPWGSFAWKGSSSTGCDLSNPSRTAILFFSAWYWQERYLLPLCDTKHWNRQTPEIQIQDFSPNMEWLPFFGFETSLL